MHDKIQMLIAIRNEHVIFNRALCSGEEFGIERRDMRVHIMINAE